MKTWVVAAVVAVVLVFAGLPALAVVLASHGSGGVVGGQTAQQPGPSPSPPGPGMVPRDGQHWRKLTPDQRRAAMAKLARQRARALERWASCLEAGRTHCARPAPPGLLRGRTWPPAGRR